jgi:predicted P-loop ATPase/GTPase
MPSQPGQVFDDDRIDHAILNRFCQFVDTCAVKVHTGNIVIEGAADNGVSIVESIAFDDVVLVFKGIELFIFVTRQAIVKPYSHTFYSFPLMVVLLQHTP